MSEIRVNTILSEDGGNAVSFTKGLNVTGVITATTLNSNITGDLTVGGNLTVDGTQTIINTETLNVADTTVGIGSTTTATDATANGAGIEIYASSAATGNNKTFTWGSSGSKWTLTGGGLDVSTGAITGRSPTLPANAQTAAYTLVATDAGKSINITTGGVTIPNSVMSAGDVVTIYNNSGSQQTITQGSGVTLRQVATTNTGNRTVESYGLLSIMWISASECVISGGGLG